MKLLLAKGAKAQGDPTQGHMVAIDARAPKFDGGISTRVDSVSFGIVVNKQAKRFYDEGEDFWPKRYAIWGRLVAGQPDQIAFSIVDAKSVGRFMPPVFPPIGARSLDELAGKLELDARAIARDGRGVQPRREARHVRHHQARRLPHAKVWRSTRPTGRARSRSRRSTPIPCAPA